MHDCRSCTNDRPTKPPSRAEQIAVARARRDHHGRLAEVVRASDQWAVLERHDEPNPAGIDRLEQPLEVFLRASVSRMRRDERDRHRLSRCRSAVVDPGRRVAMAQHGGGTLGDPSGAGDVLAYEPMHREQAHKEPELGSRERGTHEVLAEQVRAVDDESPAERA